METRLRCVTHQAMPGGMKSDLVDAIAESIVRAKLRRMFVGLKAERDDLRRPG
jgi:hypothetical protein